MQDPKHRKSRRPDGEADFAAQMARAEFGRHYIDPDRLNQVLENGEIVFRRRPPRRPPD